MQQIYDTPHESNAEHAPAKKIGQGNQNWKCEVASLAAVISLQIFPFDLSPNDRDFDFGDTLAHWCGPIVRRIELGRRSGWSTVVRRLIKWCPYYGRRTCWNRGVPFFQGYERQMMCGSICHSCLLSLSSSLSAWCVACSDAAGGAGAIFVDS